MNNAQDDLFNDAIAPAQPEENRGHLMLVEDDSVLRLLLRNSLEDAGYVVLPTESRPEALAALKRADDIAVAIVDLGLPPVEHTTLEGLALIRTVSAEYPSIKIIVLTGQDEEQSAFDAIREGAFDFLAKPARSQDIMLAVQRAFLFHRKEQDMLADGHARLQLNTRYTDGLKAVREEAEEKLVRQVLKDTGFNVYKSAEKLGIKRESIYYFMKKFQISRDDN
ncbi:MAG TPA: response regulator [Pseudomonadales bacterium]